jgi:hypothetical protein
MVSISKAVFKKATNKAGYCFLLKLLSEKNLDGYKETIKLLFSLKTFISPALLL